MGIHYVHEIQNQIPHLQNDLKIHYHIIDYVNKSNVLGRLGQLEQIVTAKSFQKRFQMVHLMKVKHSYILRKKLMKRISLPHWKTRRNTIM